MTKNDRFHFFLQKFSRFGQIRENPRFSGCWIRYKGAKFESHGILYMKNLTFHLLNLTLSKLMGVKSTFREHFGTHFRHSKIFLLDVQ